MKAIKKIITFLCLAVMLFSVMSIFAGAESNDYITDGVDQRIPIPQTYTVENVIMELTAQKDITYYTGETETVTIPAGSLTYFTEAEDLFYAQDDTLYLADTKNNRVLQFTKTGDLLNVITGSRVVAKQAVTDENGAETGEYTEKISYVAFNGPKGIFVEQDGTIYIADTGNKRIVIVSTDGSHRVLGVPESEILDMTDNTVVEEGKKDFANVYSPAKIVVSNTGYIYVVHKEAVLVLDKDNNFRSFYGQAPVASNFMLMIYRWLGLDAYAENESKTYAQFFINITLGYDDLVYAVTKDSASGEVKKLNSLGNNIYGGGSGGTSVVGGSNIIDGLISNFFSSEDNPLALFFAKTSLLGELKIFGERINEKTGVYQFPVFEDICVDKDGIITIIDNRPQSGMTRMYQYDQDRNLLAVFGGKGNVKGTFDIPSSLVVDNDKNIYVLDKGINTIQVFKPTYFISLVHNAVNLYKDGEYTAASETWKEVLKLTTTYDMAHIGLAKTEYKEQNYETAMELYSLAKNKEGYSQAFSELRRGVFRDYFAIIAVVAVVSLVTIYLMFIGIGKVADKSLSFAAEEGRKKWSWKKNLQLSVGVLKSPFQIFDRIKGSNSKLMWWPTIIIFALVVVVRIASIFFTHYPLSSIEPKDANLLIEAAKMLLPPITWACASIAVTSIWDGESKFKEIMYATALSMIPYIFVTVLMMPISYILCLEEASIFQGIMNISTVWTLFLIVGSLKTLNDYSVGKTIRVAIVVALSMVLIWLVCLLGLTLIGQVVNFVQSILFEIRMMLL